MMDGVTSGWNAADIDDVPAMPPWSRCERISVVALADDSPAMPAINGCESVMVDADVALVADTAAANGCERTIPVAVT